MLPPFMLAENLSSLLRKKVRVYSLELICEVKTTDIYIYINV